MAWFNRHMTLIAVSLFLAISTFCIFGLMCTFLKIQVGVPFIRAHSGCLGNHAPTAFVSE